MAGFRFVGNVTQGFVRNLTDLSLGLIGDRMVLVGATHWGGGVSVWDVARPGVAAVHLASHDYVKGLEHRAEPQAVLIERGGSLSLLTAGLFRAPDTVRSLGDGTGWAADWGVVNAPIPPDTMNAGSFATSAGQPMIWSARMGKPQFQLWKQLDNGALAPTVASISPPGLPRGAQIDSMDHVRIGTTDLLLCASTLGNFISAHRLLPDGTLAAGEFFAMPRGTGFNGPRDVRAVEVEGHHFLVVGSAGSSSLTTVRILPGGALVPVDHVLDERTTRFQSATVMETATIGGRTFVVVGGADDGLSLFTIAPDGRLIHLHTIADDNRSALADVSALAIAERDGRLVVFAASARESGVSQFVVDVGRIGQTCHVETVVHVGTDGADLIQGGAETTRIEGGAGDDILMAGAAWTALIGGKGADTFIPMAGVGKLIIRDFEPGIDRLDLSMLGMIRSPAQLRLAPQSWGVRIRFGDSVIEVFSTRKQPLGLRDLGDLPFPIAHYPPPDVRSTIMGTKRSETLFAARGGSTVHALDGSDTVYGSKLEDRLFGGTGHDWLIGDDGDDSIWGGPGMDRIRAGRMNDLVFGGTDNDLIFGEEGDDLLVGQDGNDFIWGGAGNDRLNGGNGDDRLFGEAGNDRLFGLGGNDLLIGGDGNDILSDPLGDNVFQASSGINLMMAGPGNDRMFGGTGIDIMRPGAGRDLCYGGAGSDTIDGGPDADTLVGQDGRDLLAGGSGDDRLYGGAGDDTLQGGAGSDWIVGHSGNDLMLGGDGADTLVGWDGNDTMRGDSGADRMHGQDGDDLMYGDWGNDLLHGHAGNDRLFGGQGTDTLFGWNGDDTLDGGDGADELFGNAGRDVLAGGAGNDLVSGGIDDDTLRGDDGNDVLLGGAGNDVLDGGSGSDSLWGGGGADVFVFSPGHSPVGAPDRICDFETGLDKIDLTQLGLSACGATGFSGERGEFRWSAVAEGVLVEADRDGDGAADMSILILGTGGLDAGDFLL